MFNFFVLDNHILNHLQKYISSQKYIIILLTWTLDNWCYSFWHLELMNLKSWVNWKSQRIYVGLNTEQLN